MSDTDRATLNVALAQGCSLRTITRILGRAPSTVSREVTRNAGRGPHRVCTAHTLGTIRAARQPWQLRQLLNPWLWQYVQAHLTQGYSPEQIAGCLRRAYPDDMGKHLLGETIHTALYMLLRGTLRSELLATLRQARKARRPRSREKDCHGHVPNITPNADRPADVASRTVPDHSEGDLLKGARNSSAVGTLVERTTRIILLARMDGPDAANAYLGFTKKLQHVPAPLQKTRTYDRGKEMTEHVRLAYRLSIQMFFADPMRSLITVSRDGLPTDCPPICERGPR